MNLVGSSIKGQTHLLLVLFLSLFSFATLFGQQPSSNDAKSEALAASREAGFETIFFTTKILNNLLNGADGIRFYSGLPARARQAVLMIIGTNADGSEIGDAFIQNNEKSELKMVDRATKETQVAAIQNSNKLSAIESFFSATDLESLLSQTGVTGLHFMPSKIMDSNDSEVLTLIVAGASSPTNTLEMTALRSPCPPECPPSH